jgi:Fe-S oxidoreductase
MKLSDFARKEGKLVDLESGLMELPEPYGKISDRISHLEEAEGFVSDLDGIVAVDLEWKPKSEEDGKELVSRFLKGLKKLLDREANWTFLYPLKLSLEYCTRCKSCSSACHVYLGSGKKEIYRPTFRAEVLRRLLNRSKGTLRAKFSGDIEVNERLILRLAELAYRCNLCRRCTQFCPIGIDNGLITREIRKLFSQELGVAPKTFLESTEKQFRIGSSAGIGPDALRNIVRFIEEELYERTGKRIRIPIDEKGSEILLIHNSGDFLSRVENFMAFAVIFEEAGVDYTLSSEAFGYDAVNYGAWYDDIQLSRIALRHAEAAIRLEVEKIVVGECGHAHKALIALADRILPEDCRIPRESCIPLLDELVRKRLNIDSSRNGFAVTLHDPCNIVRNLGIVEPQRRILRSICGRFREMEPSGVYNYCCGGGGGMAVMNSLNFPEFRNKVSARMKFSQILKAFRDSLGPGNRNMVVAPCSNCRSTLRDLFEHYKAKEICGIGYCGLAELVANSMVEFTPFVEF